MKNAINVVLVLIIIVFAASLVIKPNKNAGKNEENSQPLSDIQKESPMPSASVKSLPKPSMIINQKKVYTVTLHTSAGDIAIELDAKNTPITANNFYYLAKNGFYDNVIFHRIIPGFMIQGGDPTGTGSGTPGYQFADEKFSGKYTRGTVAMANSGPNTNGSQFFIMHADVALQPDYVIFGHVTKGMETVDKIATAKTVQTGEKSRPVDPVKIESVTITEK